MQAQTDLYEVGEESRLIVDWINQLDENGQITRNLAGEPGVSLKTWKYHASLGSTTSVLSSTIRTQPPGINVSQ